MRWAVFAIFAFLVVVVQLSVRNVLMLHSVGDISPDIVACLVVFVSLFGHRSSALWACWILGWALDLAPGENTGPHVIGPHALGYVFAGYVILQLRTMVFRRRAVTFGFLTFVAVVAAGVVAVAVLTIRSWYPDSAGALPHGALGELLRRFAIALYSGLVGIPVGWFLGATLPLWGFQSGLPRRSGGWS